MTRKLSSLFALLAAAPLAVAMLATPAQADRNLHRIVPLPGMPGATVLDEPVFPQAPRHVVIDYVYGSVYGKEMPDAKFVTSYKLPPHIRVQLSVLDILSDFVIEVNGYWYEQSDLINTGYWSYERMGEAVPYDYKPEN